LTVFSNHERALLGKVAGAIVLSDDAGSEMRRWREFFNIPQKVLSEKIGVSPSVISDYEGGRRENPGTQFVKRFVKALFEFDRERGGSLTIEMAKTNMPLSSAVLEMKDFAVSVSLRRFNRAVLGEILSQDESLRKVTGFVVVDNEQAIRSFSGLRFLQLLESITDKAAVFVNIRKEATPMVTLRFSLLKPKIVVYHGFPPAELDIELAKNENVTLIYSKAESIEYLTASLRKLYRSVSQK